MIFRQINIANTHYNITLGKVCIKYSVRNLILDVN